jgi:hypothetical protein
MHNANFAHRLPAWGVLGLATGGFLFSLLTLLFSGAIESANPALARKFRGLRDFSAVSSNLFPVSNL